MLGCRGQFHPAVAADLRQPPVAAPASVMPTSSPVPGSARAEHRFSAELSVKPNPWAVQRPPRRRLAIRQMPIWLSPGSRPARLNSCRDILQRKLCRCPWVSPSRGTAHQVPGPRRSAKCGHFGVRGVQVSVVEAPQRHHRNASVGSVPPAVSRTGARGTRPCRLGSNASSRGIVSASMVLKDCVLLSRAFDIGNVTTIEPRCPPRAKERHSLWVAHRCRRTSGCDVPAAPPTMMLLRSASTACTTLLDSSVSMLPPEHQSHGV